MITVSNLKHLKYYWQTLCLVIVYLALSVNSHANQPNTSTLLPSASGSLFDSFQSNNNADDILDADEAFRLNLSADKNHLIINWSIEGGYYLYQNRIKAKIKDQEIPITLPKGEAKDDPLFGDVIVYYHSLSVPIAISAIENLTTLGEENLEIHYQGCADIGICYPPQKQQFRLSELTQLLIPSVNAAQPLVVAKNDNSTLSETDLITQQLTNSALWLTVLSFFIAGFLLAFTPCIFPLIPILSGILSTQAKHLNSKRGLSISIIYVLSMSVVYAFIGIIAGTLGKNLQATLQNPWLLSAFAFIFVLLALSMFGFYQLQLPLSWQNKLNQLSNQKGSSTSMIGVIIMGLLSALIVGPCITPPLAGAILYIGQTGDALAGGLSLFMMSMGMGVPLIMLGTFAGTYLPKAGAWMETVKSVFGVLMLALAIYFLDRFIPVWLSMLLWATLLIISAIYMGALESIKETDHQWRYLFKGLAWLLMVIGVILLIGMASGGRSLLQPLEHLRAYPPITTGQYKNSPKSAKSFFKKATAGEDILHKLQQAKSENRRVMFYVTAQWCVSCTELELFTFSDSAIIQAMQDELIYVVDVTDVTPSDEKFMQSMQVVGPPAIVFFDNTGNEIRHDRIVGFISAKAFLQRLESWKKS